MFSNFNVRRIFLALVAFVGRRLILALVACVGLFFTVQSIVGLLFDQGAGCSTGVTGHRSPDLEFRMQSLKVGTG